MGIFFVVPKSISFKTKEWSYKGRNCTVISNNYIIKLLGVEQKAYYFICRYEEGAEDNISFIYSDINGLLVFHINRKELSVYNRRSFYLQGKCGFGANWSC